ncbi:pentatricopeptide repeat-containing protein At4g02750-like [Selaginella moellendorffii]|uniref:pentatricopeptide repeat-containing protein At4g02750-like n=1 Tax=Selaginella moellendorffii TaxID=88036 RepID=UPI000D1C42DE|nr:pentatricopeptide repeat-containing protein At4g02750-like [Selaginella moellendorffii]|eukprot:XP_024530869.1 pentatricopeptide repeat-containing protein At4g02750-like [Selaginella moellendorffii]
MCSSEQARIFLADHLQNCVAIADISKIHKQITSSSLTQDRFLANLLVDAYGRCGSLELARQVFDQISQPNVFSWGILLSAYARNGHLERAYSLLKFAPEHSIVLWNIILTSFLERAGICKGAKIFQEEMPVLDMVSWNAFLAAHAESGHIRLAEEIFVCMPEHDVVSWNTVIAMYGRLGNLQNCDEIFEKMPETSLISWNALLHCYAELGHLARSKQIFDSFPEYNVASWTTMLQAYALSGHLEEAKSLFDQMPELTLQSWTSMLHAYARNGFLEEALETFRAMPERDVVAWTGLLHAFVTSGSLSLTKLFFDRMPERSTVSWSCLIESSVLAGAWRQGLESFQELNCSGLDSNDVCFLAALIACGYGGLVHRGWQLFASLSGDFGLSARPEHYSAMVGLLARAGELDRAEELSVTMPFEAHGPVWRALLGASSVHQVGRYGGVAGKQMLELDPGNAEAFVLLSRVCTSS